MRFTTHRRPCAVAFSWLGLVAFALLMQSAAPMFAAAAAKMHGVAMVELCSVYGVRTVAVDAEAPFDAHKNGEQASGSHCFLTFLTPGATLGAPVAAIHLHAPQRERTYLVARHAVSPLDASHRWLARRHHAPPVSV